MVAQARRRHQTRGGMDGIAVEPGAADRYHARPFPRLFFPESRMSRFALVFALVLAGALPAAAQAVQVELKTSLGPVVLDV